MKEIFLAVLVSSLVLVDGRVEANTKSGVPLPLRSGESCGTAIDAVKKDLAERGYFIPWKGFRGKMVYPRIGMRSKGIQNSYYGYPEGRTDTVGFSLSGDERRISQGFISSPVLMATFGGRIMSACDRVGMVNFTYSLEGLAPVGYFPDGTVRVFNWVESDRNSPHQRWTETPEGTRIQYEWGFYYSP